MNAMSDQPPFTRRTMRMRRRFLQSVVLMCAIGLIALAGLVLFGWGIGSERLTRIVPGFAAMVPSTAVSFLMTGLVLLRMRRLRAPVSWSRRAIERSVALVLLIVGGADLVVINATDFNGIDSVIFGPLSDASGPVSMSPATAFGFVLVALCVLIQSAPAAAWRRWRTAYQIPATILLALSLTALTAYLFDAGSLHSVSVLTAMALHTATGFVLAALAIVCARPGGGWVQVAIGDGAGSHAARRLMPVVIAAPIVFGMGALIAWRLGWMDTEFRLSVMACLTIMLVSSVVLYNGIVQNRIDGHVRDLVDELERTVDQRELLVREVNHRVKNNLQQICALLYLEGLKLDDASARSSYSQMHDRIRSMATVHNLLVESDGLNTVNATQFMQLICEHCRMSYAAPEQDLALRLDVEPIELPVDTAIPLGMLICEAITNSFKYANGHDGNGLEQIDLRFRRTPKGMAELEIKDSGPSRETVPATSEAGTGLSIVRTLVRQLRGEIEIDATDGYTLRVSIPSKMIGASDD